LFHSFGEFGVPNNNIANFLNDTGSATSNILGRVTGGNVSNIFGTIQTTGFENANLFLMNPAGIVFGPTASLNVGGSVAFTTADYLRLDKVGGPKAGIFHANPAQVSLLTSARVDAFGFLGANPGDIAIQGSQLTVPEKQGIALVGGNITIENGSLKNGTIQPARLLAPNGQINLATATSPGEFLQDLTAAPNINGMSFRSFGSVHITPGSTMDFSQTGNGKVSIRGGQLVLEIQNAFLDTEGKQTPTAVVSGQDTIVLTPGSSIISRTSSADQSPDIQIIADRIQFFGSPSPLPQTIGTPVNVSAGTNGSGDAGNIILRTTGDLEMIGEVQLESTSGFTPDGTTASPILATGNAGNVELTSAHGNIRMTGIVTWATSQTANSRGNTGTVTASAPEGDILLDEANLFTHTSAISGGGGQVKISARNLQMNFGLLSTDNLSRFKPDGITVTLSGKLTMESGSLIVTSAFDPTTDAAAGDITLTAKEILVTQESLINNGTFASGPGGRLTIVTDTLQITDGGRLDNGSTAAPLFGGLPQGHIPSGAGGTISITGQGGAARSVLIDGAGSTIVSSSEGVGAGGNISVNANSVTLQNSATISASSTGPGNAGNIKINAGQQFEMRDSSITTQATKASGGNIDIQAVDLIRMVNSETSSSVQGDASTAGGNITIDPNVVVLQNSAVTARASQGTGGNITITTPLFLADSTSLVDASSNFGLNGTVTIQSPTSNVSGSLGPLTSKPSQTQALLTQRCAALANGQTSSFVVAGREQLPSDPGGWLTSLPAFAALGENLDADNAVASISTVMAIAADNTSTVSLRRLTPAGFLMANFADSEATGCRS
jgi:filamentous hemagglutinin family protein